MSTRRRRCPALVRGLLLAAALASPLGGQAAKEPLVGRLVPTFAWPALNDSTVTISPLSLAGKVALVDLWATWCGPCVREMPTLHAAWVKHRKRGFALVSLSFDSDPATVARFRRSRFAMPWQHVLPSRASRQDAVRIFQAEQFPRAVLIDRDGTVLRVDKGLRGTALLPTLDSALAGLLAGQDRRAGR
ncbi:MAG: TlpA family protein disulfide reductase [Gemmatimonadaceae bacterium]|nr:TlpA family protein disulfide reductase [Gemmatimonadaceae bacterium]